MSPIRVGLVGLAPKGPEAAFIGLWSVIAHLPSIQALPEYELVAVANSTVESAQKSIDSHGLPSSVKAYGSPEDLADDPDVDLVVVSVQVGKHFRLAKPAILKKKNVFVEWPLGASLEESEELTKLASANGIKTTVGVQGQPSKYSLKMRELIAGGKIGKVLSTSVSASSSFVKNSWLQSAQYILDMDSGGNEFTVVFGHFLHSFIDVLGNFSEVQGLLKTQHPDVNILSPGGEVVDPAYKKTAPDDIFVQGILESGALASINFFKSETPVSDKRSFVWRITGTEGEIELASPEMVWQIGNPAARITIRVGKSGEPQEVELDSQDPAISAGVPFMGQNTALVYDAYAKGDTSRYATFEQATQTHRLLQKILVASNFREYV
ncbi:related to dehydrogenases and related proteins [Cephalotrichum gorgonifer]|uniref:Related to dehydrogenases and related proteins n=1 Tax=Cephalotrichum gorgonifer TaxID=2041049 RepID=A0AAE8N5W0_9PEZI|nr:related to dehydrogenases and related proteins [Cephalotrichum gorgonifer]